jgi:hypothetical protein
MSMKNKIFNSSLFRFIRKLFPNQSPVDGAKDKDKKIKVAVEHRLRWEDDGGPSIEADNPTTQLHNVVEDK